MEIRTTSVILGLSFDLIGGILLASEMIGLIERIKSYNLKLQNQIDAVNSEFQKIGFIIAIIALAIFWLKIKPEKQNNKELQDAWTYIKVYILIIKFRINYILLIILENLTKKLGTERVLGFLGIIILCLGFIFQAIVNFIPI